MQTFYKYASFISGSIAQDTPGVLSETSSLSLDDGFLSFLRLVGCEYWKRCAIAFIPQNIENAEQLYQSIHKSDQSILENHKRWLSEIRNALFTRVLSEEHYVPSADALYLHWKRSCWISQVWNQSRQNFVNFPPLVDYGWSIDNGHLCIIWDSDENLAKVSANIKLWSTGCGCMKSKCCTKRCKCKKERHRCGPGCKCGSSCLNKNNISSTVSENTSTESANEPQLAQLESSLVMSDSDSELDDSNHISSDEDIFAFS